MRGAPMKPSVKQAEKMFGRKASPDTKLSVKDFLKKNPIIKHKKK